MPKFNDLTGRQFGLLRVVGRAATKYRAPCGVSYIQWECLCECGNTTRATAGNLKSRMKSCGCRQHPREDLTGRVFGRLTVVRFLYRKGTEYLWLTRCACGVEKAVRRNQLFPGGQVSCGCIRQILATKQWGEPTKQRLRALVRNRRSGCKKGGRSFTITTETVWELWKLQAGLCAYSGVEMTCEFNCPHTISIDRIDSTRGYEPDNVVLCCAHVNLMKRLDLPADFIDWCRKVVAHAARA